MRQCCLTTARLPRHFLLPFTTRFRARPSPDGSDTKLYPYLTLQTDNNSAGAGVSILNSRVLLSRLEKKKAWLRLISRDALDKFRIRDRKEWSWPSDMDGIVLGQLRQNAFRKLKWAFATPKARIVEHFGESETNLDGVRCVLQLQPTIHKEANPTFNLVTLLGEDLLNDLVRGTEFEHSAAVILIDSTLTTVMKAELSRLRAFLGGDSG